MGNGNQIAVNYNGILPAAAVFRDIGYCRGLRGEKGLECSSGQDMIAIASTTAITLSRGKTVREIRLLAGFFKLLADSLYLAAHNKEYHELIRKEEERLRKEREESKQ